MKGKRNESKERYDDFPANDDDQKVLFLDIDGVMQPAFVKELGEGVDRIYRDMAAAGLPEPEYRQSEFMLYATLMNKKWSGEDISWTDHHQGDEKHEDKVTEKVTEKVTDRELQILRLLSENPEYTGTQLAEKMIGSYIRSLKEKKILECIGSDRKGYWKIQVEGTDMSSWILREEMTSTALPSGRRNAGSYRERSGMEMIVN